MGRVEPLEHKFNFEHVQNKGEAVIFLLTSQDGPWSLTHSANRNHANVEGRSVRVILVPRGEIVRRLRGTKKGCESAGLVNFRLRIWCVRSGPSSTRFIDTGFGERLPPQMQPGPCSDPLREEFHCFLKDRNKTSLVVFELNLLL